MDNAKSRKLPDFLDRSSLIRLDFPSTMDVLLNYLDKYVSTMEDFLEEIRTEAQRSYNKAEDPHVRDYLEESLFITRNLFPNLLRGSFFLSAYSLLEDSLRRRCFCIEERKKPPVLLADMAGQGYIDKYKKYLEKLGGIDVAGIDEWDKLLMYGELRNRVAHHQGRLNLGNTNLVKFITDNPSLEIDGDEVIFKKGFCEEVIKTIRGFFQSLDSQLPAECQDLEPHFGYRP